MESLNEVYKFNYTLDVVNTTVFITFLARQQSISAVVP